MAIWLFQLLALLPKWILLKSAGLIHFLLNRSSKVKHISKTNINLCFPDLTSQEKQLLQEKSVRELSRSISETLVVWFKDLEPHLRGKVDVENPHYWQQALEQPQGVIMLSCHSGSVDLNVALLNQLPRKNKEFAFTYRQPSNKHIDQFLKKVRRCYADHFFPVTNLIGISRVLKKGGLVWYAPDIETSKKGRVFVKFMNVEAATPAGIGKLATSNNALVLPYMHKRNEQDGYTLKFFPFLKFEETESDEEKTLKVNAAIEKIVRENPPAYWWCIKRFRYSKSGAPSPY